MHQQNDISPNQRKTAVRKSPRLEPRPVTGGHQDSRRVKGDRGAFTTVLAPSAAIAGKWLSGLFLRPRRPFASLRITSSRVGNYKIYCTQQLRRGEEERVQFFPGLWPLCRPRAGGWNCISAGSGWCVPREMRVRYDGKNDNSSPILLSGLGGGECVFNI